MLIEPDWLNMLVDGGEMKVTSLKLTKYDRAAAKLDTSLLTGMWVKTDITLSVLRATYLCTSWTDKGVILTPATDIPSHNM